MWRTKELIRGGPKYLFSVTVFSVFFTEIVVMTILSKFESLAIPWYITASIDASLLTLLLVPELYLFVLTPIKNNIRETDLIRNELITANDRLEGKVAERTAQLVKLNQLLEDEYVEALALSEQKYKGVIESLAVGVTVVNTNLEILSVNQKTANRCSGVDFTLKPICYEVFINPPLNQPCEGCQVLKVLSDGGIHEAIREVQENGRIRIRRSVASPIRDSSGQIISVVNLTEDVTEQKKTEKAIFELNKNLEEMVEERTRQLQVTYSQLEEKMTEFITEQKIADELRMQSEERYRSLIRQSSEGIFILVPETKTIQEANNQFTKLLGYTETEIIGKTLGEIVEGKPDIIEKTVRRLIRGGETNLGHQKYIRKDGSLVDVEVNASLISFGTSAVGLVNVHDITERIKAEEHQRKSLERLRQTLDETVNAFITVTEKRDPYTAGHQHRVAQLAAAMAHEMGLDEARAKGLEVAAKLHDLGKVYVPADILNKPGILSAVEMALIKVHPMVGEEILGKIPFETPVGEIIAQHHERLDGSGYPNGLTAKQILLEAKLLAVADTVEAMASHRPYRPALGLAKAFNELETNKGTVFDPIAVETCLNVFQKGFEFSEAFE